MTTGKDAVNRGRPSKVYSWLKNIQSGLFPAICCLCGHRCSQHMALCPDCQADLPWLGHSCPRCSRPSTNPDQPCGQCQSNPPPFDRTVALFRYRPPISQLIQQFKFNDRLAMTPVFSRLLIERLEQEKNLPQAILPVPLHPVRQRERGFNQAIELARPIAKHFNLPLLTETVSRQRYTTTQSSLDARQRRKNLRGAFVIQRAIPFTHIALVDDVITTGTTLRELTRTLRQQGIERIDCWAIAKTSR